MTMIGMISAECPARRNTGNSRTTGARIKRLGLATTVAIVTVAASATTHLTAWAQQHPSRKPIETPSPVLPPAPAADANLKSGVAQLAVPPGIATSQELTLELMGSAAHIRTITLSYGRTTIHAIERRTELHRQANPGEKLATVSATHDGQPLRSVTVTASPGSDGSIALRAPPRQASEGSANQSGARPGSGALPRNIVASIAASPGATRLDIDIGRDKGQLTEIIVSVRGGALDLSQVLVNRFGVDPLTINATGTILTPDSDPLVIRLNHPEQIRSVSLSRRPSQTSGRLIVEVRAVPAADWTGQFGENRIHTGGWVLLGTATIAAAPHQPQNRAALRLRSVEGKIQRLQLKTQRQSVTMNAIDLLLADGRRETLPVNATISVNSPSALIPISPEMSSIVAIELRPLISSKSRIDAAVEVWAQY